MKYRSQMAEKLWKENAKEVSDFLDGLGVKETFQSEASFLSSAVAAVRREFRSSSLYEDSESREYVKYLFSEISTTSIVSQNTLYHKTVDWQVFGSSVRRGGCGHGLS